MKLAKCYMVPIGAAPAGPVCRRRGAAKEDHDGGGRRRLSAARPAAAKPTRSQCGV